ncbi:MAG: UDP-galactopyranose mutase [Actinobacteria bacterium]|nr:UDP-galactopyranose mutase [Actinomycetota bacterium]
MTAPIVIVGAGFSGAVVARQLAEAGIASWVVDGRSHVAGNAHTERHDNGVMVHVYGPHIFHTGHAEVWDYINRFGDMVPYNHRVKAVSAGRVYSLPVNLHTINQFFGTTFTPAQARAFIAGKADSSIGEPVSFEDQALKFVGRELYEAFFAGYTQKQWGMAPSELPASILARLPLRFSYEDSYFNHPWQAIPRNGYTPIVEAMLDHPLIEVSLGRQVSAGDLTDAEHVFWSGPIDEWFAHRHGRLGYRTLDFVADESGGDHQGCPVLNYCDVDVPHTRVTEHKHFAPWESHDRTVTFTEFSRLAGEGDIPYYPIRLVEEKAQLHDYVSAARSATGVTFLGRLGTYRYLDMDVTIKEALEVARVFIESRVKNSPMRSLVVDPL